MLAQRTSDAIAAQPLSLRVANAVVSYVRYLVQMFWPMNLAPYLSVIGATVAWWLVAGSILLLIAGISSLALRTARSWPMIAVGWFWYLDRSSPVIGLVQMGGQARADRYTYVPLIGIFVADRVRRSGTPAHEPAFQPPRHARSLQAGIQGGGDSA